MPNGVRWLIRCSAQSKLKMEHLLGDLWALGDCLQSCQECSISLYFFITYIEFSQTVMCNKWRSICPARPGKQFHFSGWVHSVSCIIIQVNKLICFAAGFDVLLAEVIQKVISRNNWKAKKYHFITARSSCIALPCHPPRQIAIGRCDLISRVLHTG